MRDPHFYYVYMMQSSSRRALYIGITGDLEHRVWQHKHDTYEGFTEKYKAQRLVYFERYGDVHGAIGREKQLKGWRRSKKEALVRSVNPEWKDLAERWFDHHRYEPAKRLDREVVSTLLRVTKETQGPSTRPPVAALRRPRSG